MQVSKLYINKIIEFILNLNTLVCQQMSRGVLAIFGSTSYSSMETVKSITNKYNIPFFSWSHLYRLRKGPDSMHQTIATKSLIFKRESTNFVPNNKKNVEYDEAEYESEYEENPNAQIEYLNSNSEMTDQHSQLYLRPDLAPVLIELIKHYKISSVYYIYNHDNG